MICTNDIKTFEKTNRSQLWNIINKRGIPIHLIEVIKHMYKNRGDEQGKIKENKKAAAHLF